MKRTTRVLRAIPIASRVAILVAMAMVTTNACSGSDSSLPGVGSGNGQDAGNEGCIDSDGDGYGVGCALGNDCNDSDPASTNECFPCTAGQAGCACDTEGLKTECGIPLGKVGDEVSCQSGTTTCTGGKWGDCVADTGSSTQAYRAPAYGVQGLGSGTACSGNPCDPYCQHWPDTPDNNLANDAGLATNDAGLTLKGNGGTLGCGSVSQKADPIPLDLYIMLDDSGSMGESVGGGKTRWKAVTDAIKGFVADPKSAGINVAVQYFGATEMVCDWYCTFWLFGCWNWEYDCGLQPVSGAAFCSTNTYKWPDVNMGQLPGNAGAIVTSLNAHGPLTNTPTLPAEQGAVQFAQYWKSGHPTHAVAVVLATDGEPYGCSSTVSNVAAAAAAGFSGTPSIKTYVVGCGTGAGVSNLDTIASSGGTTKAFIASDSNSTADFIAAMNAIRANALPCSYTVPTPPVGQQIDYSTLNIQYTNGSGTVTSMTQVANAAACSSGSQWYFTDATKTTMQVCPGLCNTIQGDTAAQVNVVYSCVQQYDPGVITRTFDAGSACPQGTTPYWGAWSWTSDLPSNSGLDFTVQVADTAAGLASAPSDALQFTDPPGPAGKAGQAIGARAASATQNGAAVVDATLKAHNRKRGSRFLKVTTTLIPSSDKYYPPTFKNWDLQVSCQPSD